MSVDVIAGVMNAVDQSQATNRFQAQTAAAAPGTKVNPTAFSNMIQKMTAKPGQFNTAAANDGGLYGTTADAASPADKKKAAAMVQLEGALMSKMVDAMVPKDQDGVYGKGLAGDTWRSFSVDQMGKSIAKSDLLHFNKTEKVASASQASNLFGQGVTLNPMKITPFAGES